MKFIKPFIPLWMSHLASSKKVGKNFYSHKETCISKEDDSKKIPDALIRAAYFPNKKNIVRIKNSYYDIVKAAEKNRQNELKLRYKELSEDFTNCNNIYEEYIETETKKIEPIYLKLKTNGDINKEELASLNARQKESFKYMDECIKNKINQVKDLSKECQDKMRELEEYEKNIKTDQQDYNKTDQQDYNILNKPTINPLVIELKEVKKLRTETTKICDQFFRENNKLKYNLVKYKGMNDIESKKDELSKTFC